MSKIADLEKDIIRYSNSYYEGRQEISDSEFDAMVDELRSLDPKSKVLSLVGWGYAVDDKQKVSHFGSSVGSLGKKKFPEEHDTRDSVISPKLDGGSIVLYYRNGILMDALTRGDGQQGMSCTRKMKYLLPNVKITKNSLVSIRGEVIIPNSYHDTLVKRGIPNPRNYANGIINRIEAGEDIKMLRFIPYSVRIYDEVLTKRQMFDLLASWGFKRIPFVDGNGQTAEDLKKLYEKWSESLPIDGVVITRNSCITASKIEASAFSIDEAAMAYKFDAPRAQVEVGSIEWQAGETGRITPVVKITKPVFLSGANITYLTAHNATQVKEKGIGTGAEITIERANEVIPYLVSVDVPVTPELPDVCPDCGGDLEWKNMDLYCYNQDCPAKQFAITKSILEVCGLPDGFGDKLLKKWINGESAEEIVNYWSDYAKSNPNPSGFHLVPDGHYEKLSFRLKSNVHIKFVNGFSYEEFWKMVRIPGLADSHAKKLRNTNPLDFVPQGNEKLSSVVNGIGSKLKLPSNVIDELYRTFDYWSRLAGKISFTKPLKAKDIIMKIVVTGPVSMPRKDFEKFLSDNGVELTETLNKEVKYLVCNNPSNSAKTQKANKLGIPIITEDGLIHKLGLD